MSSCSDFPPPPPPPNIKLTSTDSPSHEYRLLQHLSRALQSHRSIAEFQLHMHDLWGQLADYQPTFEAEEAGRMFESYRDRQRLFQFLTGLRPEFEGLTRQLLSRSPLPTMDEAVSELRAEETRLMILSREVRQVASSQCTGSDCWCDYRKC